MSIVVSLKELVGEMDAQPSEGRSFLDKSTGKFYYLDSDQVSIVEEGVTVDWSEFPDWEAGMLQEARAASEKGDLLALPSRFDIHEYQMMENFVDTVQDMRARNELLYRIKGKGAFRLFKDAVRRQGIEDDWYAFKQKAYEEIAIEWLKENGLEYT